MSRTAAAHAVAVLEHFYSPPRSFASHHDRRPRALQQPDQRFLHISGREKVLERRHPRLFVNQLAEHARWVRHHEWQRPEFTPEMIESM